jgi:hypothetical protein
MQSIESLSSPCSNQDRTRLILDDFAVGAVDAKYFRLDVSAERNRSTPDFDKDHWPMADRQWGTTIAKPGPEPGISSPAARAVHSIPGSGTNQRFPDSPVE